MYRATAELTPGKQVEQLHHPRELDPTDVVAFLKHLAYMESVAAGRQNQVLNAIFEIRDSSRRLLHRDRPGAGGFGFPRNSCFWLLKRRERRAPSPNCESPNNSWLAGRYWGPVGEFIWDSWNSLVSS